MLPSLTTPPGCCLVLGPEEQACPFFLLSHSPSIQGGLGEVPKEREKCRRRLSTSGLGPRWQEWAMGEGVKRTLLVYFLT